MLITLPCQNLDKPNGFGDICEKKTTVWPMCYIFSNGGHVFRQIKKFWGFYTSHPPLRTWHKGHDTTYTMKSALFLDLLLEIDGEGNTTTELCDKRDEFSFRMVNTPFICGNIPSAQEYGVFISQLIRYARITVTTQTFWTVLDFLQVCLRNRVMLLQVITVEDLWTSSWTHGSLRRIHLHNENWFVFKIDYK